MASPSQITKIHTLKSRLGIDGVLYEIEHYIALLNINGNTN